MKTSNSTLDCTILIPTYNRPKYLKRLLKYYNEYPNYKFNIFVADSSSEENKKLNKTNISLFSNLDINYLEYAIEITPHDKLLDALNQIKTKYCVICADDDFVSPNGIYESIKFLNENPDFTVVHGTYFGFILNHKHTNTISWRNIYEGPSIISNNPEDRIRLNFNDYLPTFYGVSTTCHLRLIFKENYEFQDDLYFSELFLSSLSLIYGKMKRLDIFYSARDLTSERTYSINSEFDIIKNSILNNSPNDYYQKYKKSLVHHLCKNSEITFDESSSIIDSSIKEYLIINYKKNNKIKKLIPRKLKKLYRVIVPLKNQGISYKDSEEYGEELKRIDHIIFN